MPAGVSWGEYLRFGAAAMASMVAGSQLVHRVYRPLDDLPEQLEQYYRDHPEIKRPDPEKPDPFNETLELNMKKKFAETGKLEERGDEKQ